jgi:NADH dehydrogenase
MAERCVVLLGGSGFVGRYLTPCLAGHAWTVRVTLHRLGRPVARGIETVVADLRHEDPVRTAMAGADAVVNLVGIGREHGQSFEAVHVEGAARVARLAAAMGVRRLLHFSALGIAEDAPSTADRTKAAGERAVRTAFPSATIVQPSLIYGPGDHFFSRFAAVARSSPAIPVIGGGQTLFQPLHVEDAARTLLAVLEQPETAVMKLALVGPETFSFRQLIKQMLDVLGRRRVIVSVPFPAAEALATGFEWLHLPLLTREEVRLLRTDKVAGGLPTPSDLGVAARPLREGLPACLLRAG